MTEYDYSPDAIEKYMAKQREIKDWVDHLPPFKPTLRSPRPGPTPGTPYDSASTSRSSSPHERNPRRRRPSPHPLRSAIPPQPQPQPQPHHPHHYPHEEEQIRWRSLPTSPMRPTPPPGPAWYPPPSVPAPFALAPPPHPIPPPVSHHSSSRHHRHHSHHRSHSFPVGAPPVKSVPPPPPPPPPSHAPTSYLSHDSGVPAAPGVFVLPPSSPGDRYHIVDKDGQSLIYIYNAQNQLKSVHTAPAPQQHPGSPLVYYLPPAADDRHRRLRKHRH